MPCPRPVCLSSLEVRPHLPLDLSVCLSLFLEVRPHLPLDLSVCLSFFLEMRPHLPLDLSVCLAACGLPQVYLPGCLAHQHCFWVSALSRLHAAL